VDCNKPYAGSPSGVNLSEFRSNTVLRWEHRPGSLLFLARQQGRSAYGPQSSEFDFPRDVYRVFDLHPNNTLLVKASSWISL